MDIELRPIQGDSDSDKEDYLALQRSVALFPHMKSDNEKKIDDWTWQELFQHKNRICYVIEKLPEHSYCGECAVKNICDDIPEIEIELMKEYQGQGIGYRALVIMLKKLAKAYGKESFYVKVEPDNYVSQLLFEKLGGVPMGIAKDHKVSEEREKQFIEEHRELLDGRPQKIAEKFGVQAELLLTHVLIYKIDVKDLDLQRDRTGRSDDEQEGLDLSRKISKAKHVDIMKEWMEDLTNILNTFDEKESIEEKLDKMRKKLLDRMDKMGVDIKNPDLCG